MRAARTVAALLFLAALSSRPALAGPTLLFDPADGTVLYAEDLDNQWHPASLTKIMTAYLTFEAIREGKLRAWSLPAQRGLLVRKGDLLRFREPSARGSLTRQLPLFAADDYRPATERGPQQDQDTHVA